MLVRYNGVTDGYVESLFGTGIVWRGEGDVQEVKNERAARAMVTYCPGLYELVEPENGIPARRPAGLEAEQVKQVQGKMIGDVPMLEASRRELVAYASDELGLAVADGHSREQILTAIANYEEVSARVASPHLRERATSVPEGGDAGAGVADGSGVGAEAPGLSGEEQDARVHDDATRSAPVDSKPAPADDGGLAGLMPERQAADPLAGFDA